MTEAAKTVDLSKAYSEMCVRGEERTALSPSPTPLFVFLFAASVSNRTACEQRGRTWRSGAAPGVSAASTAEMKEKERRHEENGKERQKGNGIAPRQD